MLEETAMDASRPGMATQPPTANAAPETSPPKAVVALVLGLLPLILWQAAMWSERIAAQAIRDDGWRRLALYTANLSSELEHYDYLPRILAEDTAIKEVLLDPGDATAVDVANRYLARINTFAGASATYVIMRDGTTLVASNWETERSFIGANLRFRPYFQTAFKGEMGRYFALGTTSLEPGYYLARPVLQDFDTDRKIIGVIVVKVGMNRLEEHWGNGPVQVMVTDDYGVVFITSNKDWKFRTLSRLDDKTREIITTSRQYHNAPLNPLGIETKETMAEGVRIVAFENGARYMMLGAGIPNTDWRLQVLMPYARVGRIVWAAVALAGFAFAVLALVAYSLFQHRQRLRDRLTHQQEIAGTLAAARDELEKRVAERTADLRTAQAELVQAAKLAMLGKLSTGINHELNQPLSAIRSYADNAQAFLDRGRTEEAKGNLASISELTARAGAIVTRLKGFARKSKDDVRAVPIALSVANAITLLGPRFRSEGIEVVSDLGGRDILVCGGAVRLEQVFVNLFANAADAMAGSPVKVLSVTLDESEDEVTIRVADSGPGIDTGVLERLFEPFFTTKEAGEGLGIGLAISYGIVTHFGGTIEAANHHKGGGVFSVRLKKAENGGCGDGS